MKKLFQIGIMLLFMIGLCSVQLDYGTPMLVDDDVGVEFATNVNSQDDAILIIMIIDNPGQVAAPLKYPLVESQYDLTINNKDSKVWKELTIDCVVPIQVVTIVRQINYSEISSTNLISEKQTGKKLANISEGLFRLEIGENFRIKNLI